MDIYAISDLHLGPGADKGHYSSKWKDHQPAIRKAWDERIPQDAIVFMPGDFSWYQDPADLTYDYFWMHDRTGQLKLMSPGNHDYGVWTDQARVTEFCERYDTLMPLMGDALRIANPYDADGPGLVVAAVRGTQSPGDKYFDSNSGASAKNQDPEAVLFVRELARLRAALRAADDLLENGDNLVVMIHYPPFVDGTKTSPFSELIEAAGASMCLYGHLHQENQWQSTFQGERNGVEYRFVGTDFLGFAPTRLGEWNEEGLFLSPIERQVTTTWTTKENSSSYGRNYTASSTVPKKASVDGFGRTRTCVECAQPVFEGDNYHYTENGCVHGTGTFGVQGTCPEIATGKVGNAFNKKLVCHECNMYILKKEPRHEAKFGTETHWIHGNGVLKDVGTCRYQHDKVAAAARKTPSTSPQQATTTADATAAPATAALPAASVTSAASTTTPPTQQTGDRPYDEVMDDLRAHASAWAQGQLSEDDLVNHVESVLQANPGLPIL